MKKAPIHISQMRKELKFKRAVNLKIWTRSGEIQEWNDVVPLRFDFYKGVRRMKFLASNQIRQVRDVCIFEMNGHEIFL